MTEWTALQRFWPAGQAAGQVGPAGEGELAERRAEHRKFMRAWEDSPQHQELADRQQDPLRQFPGPRVSEQELRHASALRQAELDGKIRISPCVREGEPLSPAERLAWQRTAAIASGDDRILRT